MRALVTTLALLSHGGTALAGGARDPARADVLFKEARDAMKRQDFKTACPKLVESQRLDPAPGTLINLAECREREGQLAVARRHLGEALDALPPGDDRVPVVKASIASLEKRLGKLLLQIDETTLKSIRAVAIDDVVSDPARLSKGVFVMPGSHRITAVSKDGERDFAATVRITAGESKSVVVMLPKASRDDGDMGSPGKPRARSAGSAGGGGGVPAGAWVAVGAGIISSVVGTVVVLKGADSPTRGAGAVMVGGGVPLLIVGIVIAASADGSPSVSLAPSPQQGAQQASWGRW